MIYRINNTPTKVLPPIHPHPKITLATPQKQQSVGWDHSKDSPPTRRHSVRRDGSSLEPDSVDQDENHSPFKKTEEFFKCKCQK